MAFGSISEARLRQVHPVLATKVRQLEQMLNQEGIDLAVVQGLRSWAEQAALFDKGRTMPGEPCLELGRRLPVGTCSIHPLGAIVTKCPPGHTQHNFGLAVDVCPDDLSIAGWQCDWNEKHPAWQRIHAVAESLGFTCGADFRTFPDAPHLQLTGRFPVNPDNEMRQLLRDGGVQAVWDEARIE